MFKRVLPIIIVILFATTVISCVMIADTMIRSNAENKDFESLAALILTQSEKHTDEKHNSDSEPVETKPETIFTRDLNPLYEKNSDCIGWICIPNTKVDYPVMHTPQDPQKYLRKNFDCEYSSSGVPFLQENNTLDSDNLIIYGHNMKNGTMFSDLKKYLDSNFRETHKTIEFQTEDGVYLFEIVDVIRTNISDERYNQINSTDGRTLALSTCYGNTKSDRLLIIAKEVTT